MSFNYSTYLSPFTTRYGSEEMRHIWSEEYKRLLWRKVWVALAKAEAKAGLVSKEELTDITRHQNDIDIPRAKEIEKEIYHELMSEIKTFSEQCKIGGGKIHLGATSTDILDNTTILQIHESLEITKKNLKELLSLFSQKIEEYENFTCMGYTHLQPAEPTTLGLRLSFYAQDLLMDLQLLEKIEPLLKGKGIKGAVGTSASYTYLLEDAPLDAFDLEKKIMEELGIDAVNISNQTYPRKIDLLVIEVLANIASSLHKFSFDYRIMQSPAVGEWMEKRDEKRVGSSAMPFKRNPDKAEKVNSLARYVSSLLPVAWSNPAMSLLERTLDDSANQRIFLPESFLAIDECLRTSNYLLKNLLVNEKAVIKNLSTYGVFSAIEPLLLKLTEKGADRQKMHDVLKKHSMSTWQEIENGNKNNLLENILKDPLVQKHMSSEEIKRNFTWENHTGIAKKQTTVFLKDLKKHISKL